MLLPTGSSVNKAFLDGKPTGMFRVADGHWKQRARSLWIRDVQLGGGLAPTGPVATVSMMVEVGP